jgi:hypothetical protein
MNSSTFSSELVQGYYVQRARGFLNFLPSLEIIYGSVVPESLYLFPFFSSETKQFCCCYMCSKIWRENPAMRLTSNSRLRGTRPMCNKDFALAITQQPVNQKLQGVGGSRVLHGVNISPTCLPHDQ